MRKKKQEYYSWMYQVLYGPPKTEKNNIMIEKSEKFEKYLKPLNMMILMNNIKFFWNLMKI